MCKFISYTPPLHVGTWVTADIQYKFEFLLNQIYGTLNLAHVSNQIEFDFFLILILIGYADIHLNFGKISTLTELFT